MNHVPQLYECQALVADQIENFVKYPPRQKAASFNLDAVMAQLGPAIAAEKTQEAASTKNAAEHGVLVGKHINCLREGDRNISLFVCCPSLMQNSQADGILRSQLSTS
jgi:hypothetical protein